MKILLILAASFLIRFAYLGVLPISLAHDEIDNVIQSYSFKFTGQDINKSWKPWAFLPNDGVMAELAPLINYPAITVMPNSLFTSHFTTAFLSSLFPLLLIFVLMGLGVPSQVSWIAGWLLVFSPWHIIFSRTSLEQPTSLFFYLFSWYFLTQLTKQIFINKPKWSTYLGFVLTYSVGFFTYHGYKFALPLLTILIVSYQIYTQGKNQIRYFVIPYVLVIGLLIRMVLYQDVYSSRQSEIIINNVDKYSSTVDLDRRISVASPKVDSIFSNKYITLFDTLKSKYLMTLSPDLLYTSGEKNGVFSVGRMGYVYLASLPFMIIGFVYLIYHHKPLHVLLIMLLLMSPIASVIHINNTLAFRSGIYFVLLNIVIAYGIYATNSSTKRKLLIAVFGLFMFMGFSRFLYAYFAIHPKESATAYFFADRILGHYLKYAGDKSILVIDSQPRYILSNLVLSKQDITENDILSFDASYSPSDLNTYHVSNIDIVRDCPNETNKKYQTIIMSKVLVESNMACAKSLLFEARDIKDRAIISPYDSGMEKLIMGDSICSDAILSNYINPKHLKDFDFSNLDRIEFCQGWIAEQ